MSDQPEALRLAELWADYLPAYNYKQVAADTAAELRRLHEENKEMLAALKSIMDTVEFYARGQLTPTENSPVGKAIAAIKKAEGL